MLKDFNATKHPGLQAILFSFKVFLLVAILSIIWEFGVEDDLMALANDEIPPETVREHIEYIATVSAFAFIALIAPTYTLYRYIQQRDTAEDQARHLATHDPMTNLPNRTLLFDRLDQAISQEHRHGGKLAVLFIDLDGFKGVNDLLGHNAGDFILTTTAQRLKAMLRETDTVARFGGDEFVAIITEVKDTAKLQRLMDKLRNEIAKPAQFDGKSVTVGASIGHAVYPDDATIPDDLIVKADRSMYEDKNREPDPVMHSVQT